MLCENILKAIGHTPLIRLNGLNSGPATIFVKLEGSNPGGSAKDRSALAMVEAAERQGILKPGNRIIESTSGNLGVALAMIGAVKGYRVTCVVDPKITDANQSMIEAFGGEIVMVDEVDDTGGYLKSRLKRVQRLLKSEPNSFWPNQYANRANPAAHFWTTGREILRDTQNKVDYLVVGTGTCGSIVGTGKAIKQKIPTAQIIAVDVEGSAIFGGSKHPRLVTGIGSSITPPILDRDLIDQIFIVTDREAFTTARLLARREGIFAGGSSGAVTAVALRLSQQATPGTVIVTLLPDRGERYLDTIYSDAWMNKHIFSKERCNELEAQFT